jgi:hypothetical protein
MEFYVWLLARSNNPRIQHGPISLKSQGVREEGKVEEDDLTRDVELQHLHGRQVPELLSCTAVAHCQILATARSSKIGDLSPDGHWTG